LGWRLAPEGARGCSLIAPQASHYAALAACVFLTAGGQLLLRKGASSAVRILGSFFNPFTIAGYGLFALNTVAGIYAMRAIELKTGTVWSSLSFPLVALAAWALLKEPFRWRVGVGCALIVLGACIFHA